MGAADAYELEHMKGQGAILHRNRVAAPRWAIGLVAAIPVVLTAMASTSMALAGLPPVAFIAPIVAGLASSLVTVAALIVFAVGRIAVSEGEVHVQIGPSGPRIPIAEIEACELGPSGTNKYGLGVGKHLDGTTIYRMMGDNARAVRITQRGRRSPIVIVCREAEAVVAAIQEAMRRARPRVRVEPEVATEGELAELDAERERERGAAR